MWVVRIRMRLSARNSGRVTRLRARQNREGRQWRRTFCDVRAKALAGCVRLCGALVHDVIGSVNEGGPRHGLHSEKREDSRQGGVPLRRNRRHAEASGQHHRRRGSARRCVRQRGHGRAREAALGRDH